MSTVLIVRVKKRKVDWKCMGDKLTDLSNETQNLSEPLALLVRVELEESPHGLIVVELL